VLSPITKLVTFVISMKAVVLSEYISISPSVPYIDLRLSFLDVLLVNWAPAILDDAEVVSPPVISTPALSVCILLLPWYLK